MVTVCVYISYCRSLDYFVTHANMAPTEAVSFNKEHMITKLCTHLDTLLDNSNPNTKRGEVKATFKGNNEKLTEVFVDLLEGAIVEVKRDHVPGEEFTNLQNEFYKLNDKFETAQKK